MADFPGSRPASHARPTSGPIDISVELEHAIGFAGAVYDGQHYHPNGRDFVYAAGACVGASPRVPLPPLYQRICRTLCVSLCCAAVQSYAISQTLTISTSFEATTTTSLASRCHARYVKRIVIGCTCMLCLMRVRIGMVQGRLLASGQSGDNADAIVWDFETREILYRYVPASRMML